MSPVPATRLIHAKMEAALLDSSDLTDPVVDPADGSSATVPPSAEPECAAPACAVELIGSFQGSGRTDDTYLAKRSDGQWVQLSPLLWLTLSNLDGVRSSTQVADCVTAAWGHPVAGEDIDYLIDKKLLPTGLVGTTSDTLEHPDLVLSLRVKKVLIPGRVVSAISRPLRFLFWPPIVLFVTGFFLGVEAYALTSGKLLAGVHQVLGTPSSLLFVAAFLICSIFVHESGHASGCRYGGATPGDMGVGVYVSSPAFYTDLSDGYRLGRSGRVRGDLGGVYFNAVFAVAVFPFYLITGSTLLLLVIAAMLVGGVRANAALRAFRWLLGHLGPGRRAGSLRVHGLRVSASPTRIAGLQTDQVVAPAHQGLERRHLDRVAVRIADVPARSARIARGIVAHHFSPHRRCIPGRGAATVAAALFGIAFTCVIMFAMTYGAVYLTRRVVRLTNSSMSGPAHSTGGGRRIRRLARTSLVLAALAVPLVWSAAHVHL